MLSCTDTVLLVVDIQEKLVRAMHAREELVLRARQLVQGARVLNVPVLCTEQNPKGLGPTVSDIAVHMPAAQPISKFSFGCCACEDFMRALQATARRNVLIAGIETHVCVYQTALELIEKGYRVEVAAGGRARVNWWATAQDVNSVDPVFTARSGSLEADQGNGVLRVGQEVLEVVHDPSAGRHAGAGDDHSGMSS